MDYQKARTIRKGGLLSLLNQKLFEENKGVKGAIGETISDTFKAQATGLKESLDPLNWIRKLTGEGALGDFAVTSFGRLLNRKDKDITSFGGYGRKKLKSKKDPKFTTINSGPIKPLKAGDSISDILGKMYNFMMKSHEEYKRNDEIEKSFRQEQLDEDERRHRALVDAIKKYTKKGFSGQNDGRKKDDSGFNFPDVGDIIDSALMFRGAPGLGRAGARLLNRVGGPLKKLGRAFLPKVLREKIPFLREPKVTQPPPKNIPRSAPTGNKPPPRGSSKAVNDLKAKRMSRGGPAMEPGSQKSYRPAEGSTTPLEKVGKTAVKTSAKALNGAKKLLKFLTSAPGLSTIASVAVSAYEISTAIKAHEEGKIDEKEMQLRIVKSLGAGLGSVAGGIVGAEVGALFGGPIGAILGGVGGAIYVGAKGEDAAAALYKFFTTTNEKTLEEKQAAIEKLPAVRQNNAGAMHGTRNTKNEPTTKTTEPEFVKDAKDFTDKFKNQLKSSAGKGRGYSPNTQPVPKTSSVPDMKSSENSLPESTAPVVAVNNTKNNIGGKPPKVLQTASAKMRDSNILYQVKNNSVPV